MNEADETGDSSDPPKRFVRIVKKSARDVVQKFLQQLTKEKELNDPFDHTNKTSHEVNETSIKGIFSQRMIMDINVWYSVKKFQEIRTKNNEFLISSF